MPLTFGSNGELKRTRGRPSAADREFERRLRAEAEAELRADLDPSLDDINSRRVPGTTRWRRGPPVVAGRSLKFVAAVAAGMDEEAARIACQLQRRAVRRLLTSSPIFRSALDGARAAAAQLAKSQCVAGNAPSASTAVMNRDHPPEAT
jgi:hypothetical protein